MATIGPTFASELITAGLGGAPCAWSIDGTYNIAALTSAQQTTFLQILAAHDPAKVAPQQKYTNAVTAGLNVTWTVSTTLNALYALDQMTQFNMTAETVSILTNNTFSNGQATRNWPDKSGMFHSFNITQFKALASAVALYVDQLMAAQAAEMQNQPATWPVPTVAITG